MAELSPKKKFLFVCVENSNRSQMSQAFCKILGGDKVESYSAGSKPSGIVNPKVIRYRTLDRIGFASCPTLSATTTTTNSYY